MTKIILSKFDRIDFRTTLENISVVESAEQIREGENGEAVIVLDATVENLQAVENDAHQTCIPSTMLTTDYQNLNVSVYFDLENYPFYQKAKEIISKEDKHKGVFRFRRTVKHVEDVSLLAGDLYVLAALLGDPHDVHVKRTDQFVTPAYIIIMLYFGSGTMAHIEYTVTDQERIEFEWSGIKTIIEFDSGEMRPVQPGSKATLPLTYSVDSILATARKVDQTIIERLNHFEMLVNGGANK
ncbi:hypothetical protein FQ087_04440 [Sporosarcina sp. ANT_H38]|uniref:hypothetical protein n=1 Tax=Sporosarcina sp. ANT_H38 TaxID=2597358 RepID=UPI0011F0ECA7|nr:hypothetical protein [Sporosarcina sp. ANT_H38]KAA0965554.1 hypothetical protein FQ087_04440 [Sporosarcina sp. ANT_H38]